MHPLFVHVEPWVPYLKCCPRLLQPMMLPTLWGPWLPSMASGNVPVLAPSHRSPSGGWASGWLGGEGGGGRRGQHRMPSCLLRCSPLLCFTYRMFVIGGVSLAVGLATYGYNIMRALGVKVTKLTNSRGCEPAAGRCRRPHPPFGS